MSRKILALGRLDGSIKSLAARAARGAFTLLLLAGFQFAHAQATPASVYRDLAAVKAGCQRVVKLHVQRRLVGNDDRLEKSLSRTLADMDRLVTHATDWNKISKQADMTARVLADMKALRVGVATPAASDSALKAAVDLADRCTADADELLKGIQGAGAGGRAVSLAARTLLLSQRLTRDWLLLHAKEKFPGITAETTTQARDEMNSALQQLAQLPATPALRAGIEQAQNQWTLLRPLLGSARSSPEKDEQVGRISERLYEALDEAFEQIQKTVLTLM